MSAPAVLPITEIERGMTIRLDVDFYPRGDFEVLAFVGRVRGGRVRVTLHPVGAAPTKRPTILHLKVDTVVEQLVEVVR